MRNYLEIAKRVITEEMQSLNYLAEKIPADFESFVEYVLGIDGRVILVGMGKSGHIAKKIAASLASTGTPSFFIHPAEASHGDLGMITERDIVVMLSNSGETKELFDTIDYCKRFDIKIAAITMRESSTLAKNADFLLTIPFSNESSSISAPTNSALMMLSLGDAIVTCLHEARGFSSDDFKNFHPGGKIGANLLKVKDLMYVGDKIPAVSLQTSFQELIIKMTEKSLGCAVAINEEAKIYGIITDGDLRRHMNDSQFHLMTAKDLITKNPTCIGPEKLASEALHIMNSKSITAIPVEEDGKLVGIIHLHDILRSGV